MDADAAVASKSMTASERFGLSRTARSFERFGFRRAMRRSKPPGCSSAPDVKRATALHGKHLSRQARDTARAMSRENVEIVRRVYDALGNRDAETILDLYDPEVEFHFAPGTLADHIGGGGTYRGHEGLRVFDRDLRQTFE